MIELRTFGSLELTRPGAGDVAEQLTQPKRLVLLVYLASARPRGFHRRDTLLALFWPELDATHAAGALSQALSHLREVLGKGVIVSRGRSEVGVSRSELWCDAVDLEESATSTDAERALALYRGDFLQGLYVPGLLELERWIEDERARLRSLATKLAWELAEAEERAGHAPAAGHWARRAASLTVHDEVALRRQLSLLERVGDRAGAIAIYDDFARRFEADFGMPPSPETEAFIQRLRSPNGADSLTSNGLRQGAPTRVAEAQPVIEPLFLKGQTLTSSSAPTTPARRMAQLLGWAMAAALLVIVGVLGGRWTDRPQATQGSWFDLALPDSAAPRGEFDVAGSIAVSPDALLLAYVGAATQSLFLRALDELSLRRIAGTDGASCPSFSPDGQWIVFTASSRLKKVAVRGGAPIVITDSVAGCGVWTDRNEILFDGTEHLYRVGADGGPVSLVTRVDTARQIGVMVPSHALPGGEAALICLSEDVMAKWQLAVVSLPAGRITRLTKGGFPRCPVRYADGHLVFGQNRSIVAAPFSLRALRITGPEVVLLRDTIASFGTSRSGALAYIASAPRTHSLVAVSAGGQTRILGGDGEAARIRRSPPTPLDTGRYSWPRLSPNGNRVVMEMLNGGRGVPPGGPWLYDLNSRTVSRLTEDLHGVQPLGWSPDSRSVVYTQIDSGKIGGRRRIVVQPWDGSAPAREFVSFPPRFSQSIQTLFDISIGPPHGQAAFVVANFSDTADIWIAPIDTPSAARPLVATKARESQPRLSPDGSLLAYTSNETGRDEVYVRSIRGLTRRVQVSIYGGWQPLWRREGRHLFYRAPDLMMRATIATDGELRVERRDTLFRDDFMQHDVVNYDVFPGGKELLMIRPNARPPAHAAVMLNWLEVLSRPTARR